MKKIVCVMLLLLGGCANIFIAPQCEVDGFTNSKQLTPTYASYLAEKIYFADGSYKLTHNEMNKLMHVAKKAQESNAKIKILGHASHQTRPATEIERKIINMNISNRRAVAVMQALCSLGVRFEDITMEAWADSRPAEIEVDGQTAGLNRRVEVFLYY